MKIKTKYGAAELAVQTTELTIPGIGREYTFVQISDLHIACSEENDPCDAVELARARNEFWSIQGGFFAYNEDGTETRLMPLEVCELVFDHIRTINGLDGVFFTGDTVDYPSAANFRCAKRLLSSLDVPCFTVPGNHDCVGDSATLETKEAFFDLMGDMPDYFVHEFDGFDVIGFSDGFVRITKAQLDFLRERLSRKKPVIILLHAPLFTDTVCSKVYPFWGYNWMVGDSGKPDGKQTEENFQFRDIVCEHRGQIAAVFAGHVHMNIGDDLPPADGDVLQYTAAPAFTGYMRKIVIHP